MEPLHTISSRDPSDDYVYGPHSTPIEQVNELTGAPKYLYTDQLGSVIMEANASGTIIGTQSYNPYGSLASSTGTDPTPFGFAGGYTDPTGLIYLIHRSYDPGTGQFLSVDPDLKMTQETYDYVGDDPVNRRDPGGTCSGPFTDFNSAGGWFEEYWSWGPGESANPNFCVYTPIYNGVQTLENQITSLNGDQMEWLTQLTINRVWTEVYQRSLSGSSFPTYSSHVWYQIDTWWNGSFAVSNGSEGTPIPDITLADGTVVGTLTFWVYFMEQWASQLPDGVIAGITELFSGAASYAAGELL